MKRKILHITFSISLIVSILLPLTISFSHTLENHEHKVCKAKNEHHIHIQHMDCSFYHYYSNYQTNVSIAKFIIDLPIFIEQENNFVQTSLFSLNNCSLFNRGPPLANAFNDSVNQLKNIN